MSVVGLLLAAGQGRRMGGGKQLLPWPPPDGSGTLIGSAFDHLQVACDEMIVVLGYQQVLGGGFRTNLEFYYQQGWNIPVENDTSSSYSYYNQREKYGMVDMVSEGLSRNYGVDLSIEKRIKY